jgi:hypothetical protein
MCIFTKHKSNFGSIMKRQLSAMLGADSQIISQLLLASSQRQLTSSCLIKKHVNGREFCLSL